MRYYSLAEQAMADGFRPCLRCRPDSAPGSCAWKGVNTTVERALNLIRSDTQQTIQHIASRLGITDRYLRDLFQQHLGLSPKRYQLYQRLLFAKQLLHQTHLSIEQVAQAAGFQSARRLQAHVSKHLKLTPRQIRATPRTPGPLMLTLNFRPPYNWEQVRGFLARRAIADVEQVDDTSYARYVSLGGQRGHFHARFDEQNACFRVELNMSKLDRLSDVIHHIRRILDLDADMSVISAALNDAGIPGRMQVQGLRLPGVWEPFEAGCRAILGQQISVKAAIALLNQLTALCTPSDDPPQGFPSAETVAAVDLSALKMPDARRQTLRAFARYCAAHHDEIRPEELLNIKGIGPWTVSYIKLRGYSEPDVWLDTDLVIKKHLEGATMTPERAAPWRSYLTLQLWSL